MGVSEGIRGLDGKGFGLSGMPLKAIWTSLGYGLFFSAMPSGALGLVSGEGIYGGWGPSCIATIVYLFSSAMPSPFASRAGGLERHRPLAMRVSFAAVLATALLPFLVGEDSPALFLTPLLLGVAGALPRGTWYRQFMASYVTWCPGACVLLTVSSFVVMVVPVVLVCMGVAPFLTFLLTLSLSWICLEISMRVMPKEGEACENDVSRTTARPYSMSPYTVALLACFGIVWGLTCAALLIVGRAGFGGPTCALFGVSVVILVFSCLVYRWVGFARDVPAQFGYTVRLVIAAAGCVWAAVPFLGEVFPLAAVLLLTVVYMLQFIVMLLFSAEVSAELGRAIDSVGGMNSRAFFMFACLGLVAALILSSAAPTPHVAVEIAAFIAVASSLFITPLLPSRVASASTFAAALLPEDESLDGRVESNRFRLVERYGLSEREQEVAQLLIDGRTRGDIAAELGLSPWTVKTHVASIYRKMGVHSNKDLMRVLTSRT